MRPQFVYMKKDDGQSLLDIWGVGYPHSRAQCWPCCFQNDIFIIFSHFPPASYWFKSQITLSRDALGINLDKNKFCNPLAFMGWALQPCKVKCYNSLQHIQDMP